MSTRVKQSLLFLLIFSLLDFVWLSYTKEYQLKNLERVGTVSIDKTALVLFYVLSYIGVYFFVFNHGKQNKVINSMILALLMYGTFDLTNKTQFQYIVSSILDLSLRRELCDQLDDLNLDCVTYISDSVYLFSSSIVGKGSYIAHHCVLSWNCTVGDHCYLGLSVQLGHDVQLGKNCVLAPGAAITGRTIIGENCKFFWRSSVLNNLRVCDNVTLGALSNITKSVNVPGNYVGSIARLMKSKPTDNNP